MFCLFFWNFTSKIIILSLTCLFEQKNDISIHAFKEIQIKYQYQFCIIYNTISGRGLFLAKIYPSFLTLIIHAVDLFQLFLVNNLIDALDAYNTFIKIIVKIRQNIKRTM